MPKFNANHLEEIVFFFGVLLSLCMGLITWFLKRLVDSHDKLVDKLTNTNERVIVLETKVNNLQNHN